MPVHLDEPGQEVLAREVHDPRAGGNGDLGGWPDRLIQPFFTTTVAPGMAARSVPSIRVAPRRTRTCAPAGEVTRPAMHTAPAN